MLSYVEIVADRQRQLQELAESANKSGKASNSFKVRAPRFTPAKGRAGQVPDGSLAGRINKIATRELRIKEPIYGSFSFASKTVFQARALTRVIL